MGFSFGDILGAVVNPIGLGGANLASKGGRLGAAAADSQALLASATPTSLSGYSGDPNASSLRAMLAGMPNFKGITPGQIDVDGSSYQAKDLSKTSLPQYDAMRERLNSQYSQNQGQAQDAIDRQFAASGGGPGNGAQAKQTENLVGKISEAKGNDLLGINAQEGQARQALQQQENQNAFTSSEAAKNRVMQGNQFNIGQSSAAQQFNAQMDQQQNQFKFTAGSSLAQLDSSWKQAQAEFDNNQFNKQMAMYQAQHSGGLFGGGGTLGLGI